MRKPYNNFDETQFVVSWYPFSWHFGFTFHWEFSTFIDFVLSLGRRNDWYIGYNYPEWRVKARQFNPRHEELKPIEFKNMGYRG